MNNKQEVWSVNDNNCTTIIYDAIKTPDDLPVTVTRNSLRQFVLEILKEKGLIRGD